MKKEMLQVLVFVSLFMPIVLIAADWTDWSDSTSLRINTSADWANIDASAIITNFPVLIKLDSSSFDFTQTETDGKDIRFSDTLGTELAYEIEYWNAIDGNAAIWVKIDTILGNSEQSLIMYWGNDTISDSSSSTAVFDTTNGFVGVYHLSEDGSTTADAYKDATGNEAHGTGVAMTSDSDVKGIIGNAQDFQSENAQYITITNEPIFDMDTTVAASAWIKVESFNTAYNTVFSKGDNTYRLSRTDASGAMHFGLNGSPYTDNLDGVTPIDDGAWHHLAIVTDGTNQYIYLDGAIDDTKPTAFDTIIQNDLLFYIGNNSEKLNRFWNGLIDEVRVSKSPRDSNWIKLEYENQKGAQSLVSTPVLPGCVEQFSTSDTTLDISEADTLMISGVAKCAYRYKWSLVEGTTVSSLNSDGASLNRIFGRISADTSITLRFSGLYDAGWRDINITVNVKNDIPDPEFTLTSSIPAGEKWKAKEDTLYYIANITNLTAIQASAAPTISYHWSTTGVSVSSNKTSATDSLRITRAYGSDGDTLVVELCLENGGDTVCQDTSIILDIPPPPAVHKSNLSLSNPVQLQGTLLTWNKKARIQIWNLDGRLIFDQSGSKGQSTVLPGNISAIFQNQHKLVKITE